MYQIKQIYNKIKEIHKEKRLAVKNKDKDLHKELCKKERELRKEMYLLLDTIEEI